MSRKSTVAKGSWIEARVGGFDGASNASTPATAASTNTTIAAAPQRILPIAASIQDFAQVSNVIGKSAAAGARRLDARLRPLADKQFFDRDVTGLLERIEMRAEIAVVFGASTFSAAMILGRIYPLR